MPRTAIGDRSDEPCPDSLQAYEDAKAIPFGTTQFALSFPFYTRCIENDGVENANDAIEHWFDRYVGVPAMNRLPRDIWFIIAGYAVSPVPMSVELKKIVSIWYFALGYVRHNIQNDYRDGIHYYTRSVEINPAHDTPYINRSFCYSALQRYAEALVDANRACLEVSSTDPYAFKAKARALTGLNDDAGAIICYTLAMRSQSNIREVQYCRDRINIAEKKIKATNNGKRDEMALPLSAMKSWLIEDVVAWVNSIGKSYAVYGDLFRMHSMNGARILKLTDALLLAMGVTDKFHRFRMMTEIEAQQTLADGSFIHRP